MLHSCLGPFHPPVKPNMAPSSKEQHITTEQIGKSRMRDWDSREREREKDRNGKDPEQTCLHHSAVFSLGTSCNFQEWTQSNRKKFFPSQMSIEATRLQSSLNKCQPMRRKLGFPSSPALTGFHDFKYTRLSRRFKCNTRVKFRKQFKRPCQRGRMPQKWMEISLGVSKLASLVRPIYTTQHPYTFKKGPWLKEGGSERVPVQSWAPGIGQVENDGWVHRLEVHRACRGINERGGSIGHHTVT